MISDAMPLPVSIVSHIHLSKPTMLGDKQVLLNNPNHAIDRLKQCNLSTFSCSTESSSTISQCGHFWIVLEKLLKFNSISYFLNLCMILSLFPLCCEMIVLAARDGYDLVSMNLLANLFRMDYDNCISSKGVKSRILVKAIIAGKFWEIQRAQFCKYCLRKYVSSVLLKYSCFIFFNRYYKDGWGEKENSIHLVL